MSPEQQSFIDSIVPAAKASATKYGVPASVTIAQAIDESGWGKSALAREANNFFGIKFNAHLPGNGYVQFQTTEYVGGAPGQVPAEFQKYSCVGDSVYAHASLLAMSPRYARAMAVKDDVFDFCAQVYGCGYSTDPAYPAKLRELITEFHLTDFDRV